MFMVTIRLILFLVFGIMHVRIHLDRNQYEAFTFEWSTNFIISCLMVSFYKSAHKHTAWQFEATLLLMQLRFMTQLLDISEKRKWNDEDLI